MKRPIYVICGSLLLASCGSGGGGASIPATTSNSGSGTSSAQSANYFPLAAGNSWTYQGGLYYAISSPITVSGQTAYPYQGGCNEWDYLYKDSSGNVYSIGQTVSGTGAVTVYPQPQLIVRSQLSAGMTWQNNLGFVTESVSVGSPVTVTVNGANVTGYPIATTDHYSTPSTGTTVFVANYGPVQVTNWCPNPSVQENLTSVNISASSI